MKYQKKPDSVVNALRDAILSGGIANHTEMTQTDLADSLGVSRMPIREALLILEYQGLVERLPNQHVRAAELDRAFFTELFSLSADLECRLLEQNPETTETALAGAAAAEAILAEAVQDELSFHRTLLSRCENAFFHRTLETVIETYIAYGIGCPGYDSDAGLSHLRRICTDENRKDVLTAYYAALTDAIMEVRSG
ncbi:MAG: GntR family transcriptional regulator [Oscillibacter sp.]|nr:GntR family transcriptional regulator [Oscillibacter sp.]